MLQFISINVIGNCRSCSCWLYQLHIEFSIALRIYWNFSLGTCGIVVVFRTDQAKLKWNKSHFFTYRLKELLELNTCLYLHEKKNKNSNNVECFRINSRNSINIFESEVNAKKCTFENIIFRHVFGGRTILRHFCSWTFVQSFRFLFGFDNSSIVACWASIVFCCSAIFILSSFTSFHKRIQSLQMQWPQFVHFSSLKHKNNNFHKKSEILKCCWSPYLFRFIKQL